MFSPAELRKLRCTRLDSYFKPGPATDIESLTFDSETIERFHRDFETMLRQRKSIQGLARAGDFHQWWMRNHAIYLTRPVVETYIREGLTLGELFDDMHLHYVASQAKACHQSVAARLLRRVTKRRAVFAALFPLVLVAQKASMLLWSLLILGPGVQMVNSYTNPVVTPLAQTANQKGAQDLAFISTSIQGWLTNRDKLREIRRDIDATTQRLQHTDFKNMKPEQVRAKWADFEQTYFNLFLTYNQTLPSHLRDGRSFFRDWMVFTPVGLATNLAAFDTQYWTHRRELGVLKAKQAQGLSAEETSLLRIHKAQMSAAESRIAATLAAWKIYEFMFPEFAAQPVNANGKLELKNAYGTLIRSMRFDLYVDQFTTRVREVLKFMDAEFLMQEQLSRVPAAASKQ